MNTQEKYLDIKSSFNDSLKNYVDSLSIITIPFPNNVVDAIKSGQIQKFEMTTELAWKCCKLYIEIQFGDIVVSPKLVYKELFRQETIDEDLYLKLIDTIEDRNKLSHIYKERMFHQIHSKLNIHAASLQSIYNMLNAS